MSHVVKKSALLASRSANLESAATTILVLGLLGSAIMIIVGFIPTCPLGFGDCYSDEKVSQWGLVATGATAALAFWWLFAFSSVIASKGALAAEIASPTTVQPSDSTVSQAEESSEITEAADYQSFRKEEQ